MQNVLILLFTVLFSPQITEDDPLSILQEARHKIEENQYIKYRQQALYPNPVGLVDTMNAVIELKKASSGGFDFKFSQGTREQVKLKDDLKIVNHSTKRVVFFSDRDKIKDYLRRDRNLIYSPVSLLKKNWNFLETSDTYLNFRYIETDTVVEGNTIRTEYHIFLNKKSKVMERFERRNYFRGQLSQTIIFKYSDYELNNVSKIQPLTLSLDYVSEPFEKAASKPILQKGSPAVLFKAEDLSGQLLDLASYKGKKVLLVFSAISCGSSLSALEFLKSENLHRNKDILIIYIKPEDTAKELRQFIETHPIPFPVIPNAKEIGQNYGVSAYPAFFLLNEEQVVQEVRLGVDRAFLRSIDTQ